MTEAKKPMPGSSKIALGSLALGAAVAAGVGYLAPAMVWWLYAVITVIIAAMAYPQWLQMAANEKIIDRGDWPNKK